MNTLRYLKKSKTCRTWSGRLADQNGMSLLYVIGIIVLFALLISASVVMFGTSTFTSATANASQRALYLAESGLRYLREQYSSSAYDQKSQTLTTINGSTYSLGSGGSEGQFKIDTIEPFWFYHPTASTGTTITLTIPGDVSNKLVGTIPANGELVAATGTTTPYKPTLYEYTGGSLNPTAKTFTANISAANLPANRPAFLVTKASAGSTPTTTSVTVDGIYFPPTRGQIGICVDNNCEVIREYFYDNAAIGSSTTTLTGVKPPPGATYATLPPINPGITKIELLGSANIAATGSFQNQDVKRTISNSFRAVNLHKEPQPTGAPTTTKIPIPLPVSQFEDKQTVLPYFSPNPPADVDVKLVFGDRALNLKAPNFTTGLSWATQYDLPQFDMIRFFNNNLLDYGVQIKVYLDAKGKNPDYLVGGLSFRLDDTNSTAMRSEDPDTGNSNTYGISFFRITDPTANPVTWQNLDVLPVGDYWYIIFWKCVYSGETPIYTILAYQDITNTNLVIPVYDKGVFQYNTLNNWSTLMFQVKEKIRENGVRYNEIKVYYQAATAYPRDTTPTWDTNLFQKINWTPIPTGSTATRLQETTGSVYYPIVEDESLNTLAYDGFTNGIPNKPREIGIHALYSLHAGEQARVTYFDDFYLDVEMTTGGGSTGGVFLQ